MQNRKGTKPRNNVVRMATTTSTADTGLLGELKPAFDAATGYNLKWEAVGSGAAMEMGMRGMADVLLTHARLQEEAFVNGGYGIERIHVMFNQFILVGPQGNGNGLNGTVSLRDAFTRIAGDDLPFASRGDNSGTHIREIQLWDYFALNPYDNENYFEVGAGMFYTLRFAAEEEMYCLTDDGTWIRLEAGGYRDIFGKLRVISADDPLGFNQYAVIPVNPKAHFQTSKPVTINTAGAAAFVEWMRSAEAKQLIDGYRIEGSDQRVFVYNADRQEPPFPFSPVMTLKQPQVGANRYGRTMPGY